MPPRAHLLMLASIACSGLVAGAVLLVLSAAKTTSATAATTKAAAHARGNSAVATLSPGAPKFGDIATSSRRPTSSARPRSNSLAMADTA